MLTYSSRECQKADWKKHKKVCAARAAGDSPHEADSGAGAWAGTGTGEGTGEGATTRPSVLVDPAVISDSYQGYAGGVFTTHSIGGGTTHTTIGQDTLRYDPNRPVYVIKVQGGGGGAEGRHPLMIYDHGKHFQLTVDVDKSPGKDIRKFMCTFPLPYPESPHPGFTKVFLHARTEEKGLRIFLDTLAPWQTW
jgi:hypothetical protein